MKSSVGFSAAAAQKADASLPGYIYEAVSNGRNWNPRLYHEPKPESSEDVISDGTVEDPYDELKSSYDALLAATDEFLADSKGGADDGESEGDAEAEGAE